MELKRSHRTTDLAQRHRFVRLWVSGNSARAIAQQTGASATTVCRWIRRWRNEGHVSLRHRKGRPREDAKWNHFARRTAAPCPAPPPYMWHFRCPQLMDHRLSMRLWFNERHKHSYVLPSYSFLCLENVLNRLLNV